MLNIQMTINSLERKITNTKSFLERFTVRKGHSLLDHTVARLIWGAIASSDGILTLAEGNKFNCMYPLVRNLFETTFTLNYIINSAIPDRIAARIFVWEIIQKEKEENFKIFEEEEESRKFVAQIPYSVILKELKIVGENTKYVEEAFSEATHNKRSHWHWSGQGPGSLIAQYKANMGIPELDLMISGSYKYWWSLLSSGTHASARWANPYISSSIIKSFKLSDPLAEDQTRAAAMAGFAGSLVSGMLVEIKEYYKESALKQN